MQWLMYLGYQYVFLKVVVCSGVLPAGWLLALAMLVVGCWLLAIVLQNAKRKLLLLSLFLFTGDWRPGERELAMALASLSASRGLFLTLFV